MPDEFPPAGLALEKRPLLARGCRISDAPGQQQTLLLPESALLLNDSGRRILALCDGQRTIAEVLGAIELQFPVAEPGRVRRESLEFLAALAGRGALDLL